MSVDTIQKYNLEAYKLRKPQKEDLQELLKACQKNLSENHNSGPKIDKKPTENRQKTDNLSVSRFFCVGFCRY